MHFNSIKVRLEQHPGKIEYLVADYFNSIKVRLELYHRCGSLFPPSSFQFHKGAIRTFRALADFHFRAYFNSIKVRLERQQR